MSDSNFVSDFILANLEKIGDLAKKAYGKADAKIQTHLRTAYKDYLNESRLKYSKSKSFFIRDQPVELYSYYVPTGISTYKKLIAKPNSENCLEFSKRIVISGSGGSGKSVLMKHLFLDCIQKKEYVPILIELRDLNVDERKLDDLIGETLDGFGFKATTDYIQRAQESGHFCYILDGLDEVTPTLRRKVISQIKTLSMKYVDCPIIISSRPDDGLIGLEDFSNFRMQALNLDDAIGLVSKLPFDEQIKKKFCQALADGLFEKHTSFLSNPLLLSIMLLTYGENAEIPAKLSIFYNQAYEALFRRHDAYKGAFRRDRLTNLDIQDFSRVFSLFCVQTYEKRIFKMSRTECLQFIDNSLKHLSFEVTASDYLNDLLSAACLMIEDGLEITLSHRSFQEYFVALYISTASPKIQEQLIDRYLINVPSDNVMFLLGEINPELFERELLVKKLELFFNKLEVNRSVGITHYLRFLKYAYSRISFENRDDIRGICFSYPSTKDIMKEVDLVLLRVLTNDYSEFKPSEISENYYNEVQEAFFKNDFEYPTASLTINSPIVRHLASGKRWHGCYYLDSAYKAYKKLKSKHTNSPKSLYSLLGL